MTDLLGRGALFLRFLLTPVVVSCAGSEFATGGSADAGPLADASLFGPDGGLEGPIDSTPVDIPEPILEASVIGGVSVLPPGGLVTSEDGGQASFEIVLVNEPSATVRIGLESSDPTEGTISVSELVFTRSNWDSPQTVVITGQDDEDVDGNRGYLVHTLPAVSSDPQYDGVDAADIAVANLDDDEVGIRFTPAEGLVTGEDGTQAHFTARLTSKPSDQVAVFLTSSDATEGAVSPGVLTFTGENWNSPRMVTVTGLDDDDADGPREYFVDVENIISADDDYGAFDPGSVRVSVLNTDDDSAGATVTGDELVTAETGERATFTVALNREPNDLVLIQVVSSDPDEGTVEPTLLTFTPDNWNAPQEVAVTGVDDDEADGPQSFRILLLPAVSLDPAYDGLELPEVTVTNLDDESAGFVVAPGEVVVSEGGDSQSFELRLTTRPSAAVTIALTVNDPSEASIDQESLTFTQSNWATPQLVSVSGTDDDEADGAQSFVVLTAPAQSDDDGYRGLNPADVTGTNLDDDTAGISVTPTSNLVTSEEGGSVEFVIALQTPPAAPVRILLRTSDDSEGDVEPNQVEFDADNWSVPSTVVVTGIDDAVTDGAQPYSIVTELETDDAAYLELAVPDVAVVNRDDECPVPELIDDLEDADLALCPSQGRSGTWLSENVAFGSLVLEAEAEPRNQSSHALRIQGEPSVVADPVPVLGGVFGNAPVVAANFGPDPMQPIDASGYTQLRFWARSSPPATLHVAIVTTESAQEAEAAGCSHGCGGHYGTSVVLAEDWQPFDVPFSSLASPQAQLPRFTAENVLGLKFSLESGEAYELWLDDVAFSP